MSLSLRLPASLESDIFAYSARTGLSKSAVIVRSIEAFLRSNAQPSAFDLYEEAMRSVGSTSKMAATQDARPHKQAIAAAIRRKHAGRSTSALRASVLKASAKKKAA